MVEGEPPVIDPEPTGKLSKDRSDHPGPGHELPFWRLDAALAAAVMSIQIVKGVEIGLGFEQTRIDRVLRRPALDHRRRLRIERRTGRPTGGRGAVGRTQGFFLG